MAGKNKQPERRNEARANDAPVFSDDERKKKKELAKNLSDLMKFGREAKKEDEDKRSDFEKFIAGLF